MGKKGLGRPETRRREALGRVLDPEARDASSGPRARLSISVPLSWAVEGATLRVRIPRRLPCARCDGGGCDGCGRSGAHRLGPRHADAAELELPAGSEAGVALRLAQPFGTGGPIDQLIVEVRVGEDVSDGVTRISTIVHAPPPSLSRALAFGLAFALVIAMAWIVSRL